MLGVMQKVCARDIVQKIVLCIIFFTFFNFLFLLGKSFVPKKSRTPLDGFLCPRLKTSLKNRFFKKLQTIELKKALYEAQ